MKKLLTSLALLILFHKGLIAQVLQQSVSEDVSSPIGIAGTPQSDVVVNAVDYLDPMDKDHGPQLLAAPPNDACLNAVSITVGAACVNGTTKQASKQAGESFSCQGTPTQSVWYKFVATATSMYVEVNLGVTSGCYLSSAVWSGTCLPNANLSCIAASSGLLMDVHNLAGLTVGTTYYIQVCYTAGGACGSAANTNTGATFCIDVGIPVVCKTCTTPCGPLCVFASQPTVAQVTGGCPQYPLKPAVVLGASRTECYTFKANSTTFNLQAILNSVGCPLSGGNVTTFNWTLQTSACGAIFKSGNLSNLNATGLTINQNYVLCYTWTSACQYETTIWPYIVSNSPLPVELLDFHGTMEMNHVELDWATASETNNNYFSIERSADRINFEKIGQVEGAGNSTQALHYSFYDREPLSGISYYRLKQTDYDGKESNSPAIAVNSSGKDVVRMLPNPVKDQLFISVNSTSEENLAVSICNTFGQEVYSKNNTLSKGPNQFTVDVNALSKGAYFVRVSYKDKTACDLIMKQ